MIINIEKVRLHEGTVKPYFKTLSGNFLREDEKNS
jgi:hypothetical protein